jgi:hypothetical protein
MLDKEDIATAKEIAKVFSESKNDELVVAGNLITVLLAEREKQRPSRSDMTWAGLTDIEKRSICRIGPVYAPDGVVTLNPLEYRKELKGVALMAVRKAEAKLKEKNSL